MPDIGVASAVADRPARAPCAPRILARRRRRVARWSFVAAAVLAILVLLVPLPRAAVNWLAHQSSGWLLTEYEGGSAPARHARKFTGLWLQQSVAAHVYEAQRVPEGLGDAERVAFRLARLKPLFISQTELQHAPVNAPVGLAGIGWCDGINGFAAQVLAQEFSRVEIVGVYDQQAAGGHSFGRLWSDELQDWLYFDLWADEVVVFRSRAGEGARFLARMRPLGDRNLPFEDMGPIRRIYDRAHEGLVHNRLQRTLGGYLFSRIGNLLAHGNRAPAGAAEAIAQVPVDPLPEEFRTGERNRSAAPEAFLRARLAHLAGDTAAARAGYAEVLNSDPEPRSTYRQAAQIFIARIDAGRM